MNQVQMLIIGCIAVLVGVVLIGPVTSVVGGSTQLAVCPTAGGTPTQLDGSGTLTVAASDVPIGFEVVDQSGSPVYAAGTLCTTAATLATLSAGGQLTTSQESLIYAISGAPGGNESGVMGYGHDSSRALAILIPLVFVSGILVVPIYMIWSKMRG